jgi:hypothetical protein
VTRHRVRCLHAVTTTLSRTHTHCRRANEPRPTNRPPLLVSLSVRRPKVLSSATEVAVHWPSNAPFRGLHASLDSKNGKPFLSSWAPITQGDAHPRDSLPEIRLRHPSRKRVEPSKTAISTRLEIDNVECSPDDSPRNRCARRSPKGPSFASAPRGWGTRGEDYLILTGCQLFATVTEVTSFEPGRPIGSSTNTGSENFTVRFIPRVTSEETTRRIHPTPFCTLFLNPLRTRGGTNTEPRHQHLPFCNEPCRMRNPSSAMASRSHCPKIALRTVHLPTEAFSFRACRDSPPFEGFSNTLFYRCSFNPSRTSPDEGKPSRYASFRAEPLSPKRKTFESRSLVCRHASETESLRPHCSMSELGKSPTGSRHPKRTEEIQMDTTRFFLPPAL